MNLELDALLEQTERAVRYTPSSPDPDARMSENRAAAGHLNRSSLHVGVDLGTAYTVLIVLDEHYRPVAGAYRFAEVVRDGLVVDFIGAIDLLKGLKNEIETRLGRDLQHAATGYPPGVPRAEIRATANVIRAVGLDCSNEVDEPTAANSVLQIRDGAVVDVGGGTTGVAVVRDGRVVYAGDEATGGTHFSLVIAGALDIPLEKAEQLKINPQEQARLYPLVEPVMEKVASIVMRQIRQYDVRQIYMVGGTSMFTGIARVVERVTGIKTIVPSKPLFVTPLGIAMNDNSQE
jgi:ethanolamine utilization protein EutJ